MFDALITQEMSGFELTCVHTLAQFSSAFNDTRCQSNFKSLERGFGFKARSFASGHQINVTIPPFKVATDLVAIRTSGPASMDHDAMMLSGRKPEIASFEMPTYHRYAIQRLNKGGLWIHKINLRWQFQ
jgi:hypothetical protein